MELSDGARLDWKAPDISTEFLALARPGLREVLYKDKYRKKPGIVGVFHESPASRPLTSRLARRLSELSGSPAVFSDRPDWEPIENVPHRPVIEGGRTLTEDEFRQQMQTWEDPKPVLVDIDAAKSLESATRLTEISEEVIWCVSPDNWRSAARRIAEIESRAPGWKDKVSIVWILGADQRRAPLAPELLELAKSDFKIAFSEPSPKQNRLLANGVERVVNHLRGIQVGLALGGGAARGMAHLGVLKVLEKTTSASI